MFFVIRNRNSDYLPKQHKQIVIHNEDPLFSMKYEMNLYIQA